MKIEFDQLAALIIFLICAALVAFKIDGEVKTAMMLSVGYLVGTGIQRGRQKTEAQ